MTVLACAGSWNKEFVTSVPSHTVHKEAAGRPCELFWSQQCRQSWRLFRALWWPLPFAGFLQGIFCSLYKMPKAFDQSSVLNSGTVEVCLPQLIQRIVFWDTSSEVQLHCELWEQGYILLRITLLQSPWNRFFFFFKLRIITFFKVFIEFATILLLFYVLVFLAPSHVGS